MKRATILPLTVLIVTLSGCRSHRTCDDLVKETYVHQYGVPVAKSDWEAQGHTGQVIQVTKEGVTTTQSFVNGTLHGETTYTFPHSSIIQRTEIFDEGVLRAERTHYATGVPMREELYDQGAVVKVLTWYEEGVPASVECYRNHYLIQGEYYTPLNRVETTVCNGEGSRVLRSSSGQLLTKDMIQNGEMVERITYFPSGEPEQIIPYERGVIHGTLLIYLPGGEPQRAEVWQHGKQEGTTIVYQNGEKYAEIPYVKGKKNGLELRYREGTMVAEEISWKDDVQHGIRKIYAGGVTKTEWYHEGAVVSRFTFERLNMPQ